MGESEQGGELINVRQFEKGPWSRMQGELNQEPWIRQDLIRQLEEIFKRNVITFFTSFDFARSSISNSDAEMIEEILHCCCQTRGILLILDSPGGDAMAAERIANVCRSYAKNDFEVLVPHMAKSAATMICFGAGKIHMSDTSELGPVDPQVGYFDDRNNQVVIAAAEYVRSYDSLMEGAIAATEDQRIEPILQQLSRYDARYVETLRSALDLSEDISVKLLESGMMNGTAREEIKRRIAPFLLQKETKSHGRMITRAEAAACGLKIEAIALKSECWKIVRELAVRSSWIVQTRAAKLLESSETSLTAGAPE